MMIIRFKRLHPDAILPTRGTPDSIALDLYCPARVELLRFGVKVVPLGLAVCIPQGHYGRIADRSGLAKRGLHILGGVIDPDYRGELTAIMLSTSSHLVSLDKGDRIAQLILERASQGIPEWVEELSPTERGSGGLGSTGR